jgi:hypothetical protein
MKAATDGTVLAHRGPREGPGFVVAEIEPRRQPPLDEVPSSFWLRRRGLIPSVVWNTERLAGRRWYRRNVRQPAG